MNRLILPWSTSLSLRERLLHAPLETAGILFAHSAPTASGHRLIFRDFAFAPDDAYVFRSADRLVLHPNFLASQVKTARTNGWSILLTHTHPWDGIVGPSEIDREGEQIFFPAVFRRVSDKPHGRLILGHNDYSAALFSPLASSESSLRVYQVGSYMAEFPTITENQTSELTESHFDRQIRMFGSLGQNIIAQLCVGIVGLGGTGSVVVQELAHLGVGSFVLIDPDVIEKQT